MLKRDSSIALNSNFAWNGTKIDTLTAQNLYLDENVTLQKFFKTNETNSYVFWKSKSNNFLHLRVI